MFFVGGSVTQEAMTLDELVAAVKRMLAQPTLPVDANEGGYIIRILVT